MDPQVVFVAQERQHGVGYRANAHLQVSPSLIDACYGLPISL